MTATLTAIQARTLAAAQRARREPKMECMFTEGGVLRHAPAVTRTALERRGLIESYLVDNVSSRTLTLWRLTAAGIAWTAVTA